MNTISSNLPEMAKGVKMLAALMDDEGANGDDLMMAAKQVHLLPQASYKYFRQQCSEDS